MRTAILVLLAAIGSAGCNSSAPVPPLVEPKPGTVHVTPQGFQLPAGGTCRGEVDRYRAIQNNDLSMGHVNPSVFDQIKGEIAGAEAQCAAGHDAQGIAMIRASKSRHGYPTDL